MTNLTVYLDTNIFSRITDLKISDETAFAYRQLAEIPELSFVTSAKTKQEMERTPNEARASMLLFLFSIFAKIPWKVSEYRASFGSAPFGICPFGGVSINPKLTKLKDIFDTDDATHIFQASEAGCHYFLTLDEKTILSRARKYEASLSQICPQLKFRSPIELASELRSIN